jgi:hypothetical protein
MPGYATRQRPTTNTVTKAKPTVRAEVRVGMSIMVSVAGGDGSNKVQYGYMGGCAVRRMYMYGRSKIIVCFVGRGS